MLQTPPILPATRHPGSPESPTSISGAIWQQRSERRGACNIPQRTLGFCIGNQYIIAGGALCHHVYQLSGTTAGSQGRFRTGKGIMLCMLATHLCEIVWAFAVEEQGHPTSLFRIFPQLQTRLEVRRLGPRLLEVHSARDGNSVVHVHVASCKCMCMFGQGH